MSQLLKVQLEDEDGNIYCLHTSGDSVFLDDGRTVQAAIEQTVRQSAISNVQVNDTSKVPSAALAYAMQQQITENEEAITGLNSELINDSGLSLANGIYYVPYNTDADTIIWSGLYDCSGVIIDGTNCWGYMLVFAGTGYVKQLFFHNASPAILVRQRRDGDEWHSWLELGPQGPGVRLYSNDVTIDVSRASGSASPWTYTATGLSCQTGDQIIVGYLPQSTASADKNAAKAYGYLAKAECTTNGQLKLTFLQAKPATDFKIRVLSFRTVS